MYHTLVKTIPKHLAAKTCYANKSRIILWYGVIIPSWLLPWIVFRKMSLLKSFNCEHLQEFVRMVYYKIINILAGTTPCGGPAARAPGSPCWTWWSTTGRALSGLRPSSQGWVSAQAEILPPPSSPPWSCSKPSARNYRHSFCEDKPKTLVFYYWIRAFWACFHENAGL